MTETFMKNKIRNILWRILGIDYNHILKVIDFRYLKEDSFKNIGHKSYDNGAVVYRWSDAEINIGKYCSISYDVKFVADDGSHTYNSISSYPFKSNKIADKRGIEIGNDVWIGLGATILYGVKIGDGATIAAGSVVTRDVEPYTVVGGAPAKFIKEKCTREEALQMQKIAWWDWGQETIENRVEDFKLSYKDFISKYAIIK